MTDDPRFDQICEAAEAGHPSLVLELVRPYLIDHPNHPWALLHGANALCDLARYEEAAALGKRALDLLPRDQTPLALSALGHIAVGRSDLAGAEQHFRDAISIRPDHASAYVYLGAALGQAGRLAEAEAVLRRGVDASTGARDEAYFNLGIILRARGDHLGALGCFRQALELDPQYSAAKTALADVEGALFRLPAPDV